MKSAATNISTTAGVTEEKRGFSFQLPARTASQFGFLGFAVLLGSAVHAENYICRPTLECIDFPNACTESTYKDDEIKISYSEQIVTVDLNEYGLVEFKPLAAIDSAGYTSLLIDFEGSAIFASMFDNGLLSIYVPDGRGVGIPITLQLNCETNE